MKTDFVELKNRRIPEIVESHEVLKVAADGGNGLGIMSMENGVETWIW